MRPIEQLPLSGGNDENKSDGGETYERKGAFRLKRDTGIHEFRFPKSTSQPEPLWRAGDAFSGDEGRPDFVFSMNGKHKQKRPRSLPGIGKLQLEKASEKATQEGTSGTQNHRSKVQHLTQCDMKHRRGAAKDVWPTVNNFSEELGVRKRNPIVPDTEKIIPSTVLPKPTLSPRVKESYSYVPPSSQKRKHSHFENFGKRFQRSISRSVEEDLVCRGAQIHTAQLELGDGTEEYEDEGEDEEFEMEDQDEVIPATRYDGGDHEDGEGKSSNHEDAPSASQSRESTPRDSATANHEHRPPEAEQYLDNIWAAGDVGRQALMFSQALS